MLNTCRHVVHLGRVGPQSVDQDGARFLEGEGRRLELALLVVRAAKADEVLAHLDGVGAERLLVEG